MSSETVDPAGDDDVSGPSEMVVVRFLRTPVEAFLDLQEALDGFQREIQLGALGGDDAAGSLAGRLVELRERMADIRTDLHDQCRAARQAGEGWADLVARYPAGVRPLMVEVMAAARNVDAAAEAGSLLGTPLPEGIRQLQAWMFEEVLDQLEGAGPRPFRPSA